MNCRKCDLELNETNKYVNSRLCKKCYNKQKKTTPKYIASRVKPGLHALTPDERFALFRRLEDKEITVKQAADAHGIKYNTMYVWYKNYGR